MKASTFLAVFATALLSTATPVPEEQAEQTEEKDGAGSYTTAVTTYGEPSDKPDFDNGYGGTVVVPTKGPGTGYGGYGHIPWGPPPPGFPGYGGYKDLPIAPPPPDYHGSDWPPAKFPPGHPLGKGGLKDAANFCSNQNVQKDTAISCCSSDLGLGLDIDLGLGLGLGCTLNIIADICSQKGASIACCPVTGNSAGPLTLINLGAVCVPITL